MRAVEKKHLTQPPFALGYGFDTTTQQERERGGVGRGREDTWSAEDSHDVGFERLRHASPPRNRSQSPLDRCFLATRCRRELVVGDGVELRACGSICTYRELNGVGLEA